MFYCRMVLLLGPLPELFSKGKYFNDLVTPSCEICKYEFFLTTSLSASFLTLHRNKFLDSPYKPNPFVQIQNFTCCKDPLLVDLLVQLLKYQK